MALRFAANLNFLFTEDTNLEDRIYRAHQAGFRAVEIPFPFSPDSIENVVAAKKKTGVQVALINIALGVDDYKLGSASIPGAEDIFKIHLTKTIELAKALDCKKIHIMAGIVNGPSVKDTLLTYKTNLRYAVTCLEKEGLVGLIEPINKYAVPTYFMNSYETASTILREINNKHLKLLLDIFHLQHICGNVTNILKDMNDIIGHIQIAQVPHRHEPDSMGELDFGYIFHLIEDSGYQDWIGCEYKPKTSTIEGLKWISKYGYNL